jgi:bifunctional DNA-binding transcriptional regulator/antitoxin component of YhaV-PrlF toxin-antitoxin module
MTKNTVLPSIKGQITLPPSVRKRYNIGKDTPITITDDGKGKITLTVGKIIDLNDDLIEYYENDKSFGLKFNKPISAGLLLKKFQDYDG